MLILHGSLGLGDAVYMWPVVKHYAEKRNDVVVVTRYPELYAALNCQTVRPEDVLDCRCSARTKEPNTNIYQDTLMLSGVETNPPLEIKYGGTPRKYPTVKPVCIIRTPSFPVKGDESARCMVPDISVYQKIINAYRDRVFFVSIGWAINVGQRLDVDLDLTAIQDLRKYFSAIDGADIVITQPGHCVPIAEALKKSLLIIFAAAGLTSQEKRYRFTTPEKIITRETTRSVVDNYSIGRVLEIFGEVLGGLNAVV